MVLFVNMFGSLNATHSGHDLTFTTNAARALLAYLAAHAGQAQMREHLVALFYPDQSQSLAFTNLRSTLTRVRKALQPSQHMLQTTRQSIEFGADLAQVDVLEFEKLLADCAAHRHLNSAEYSAEYNDIVSCPECIQRLQRAIDLYKGEFLHGLMLTHNQPFEEWMLFKREQLQRQMVDALGLLARSAENLKSFGQMERYVRRQLELDPLREEAHVQLIHALVNAGQRSAAIAHYMLCVQLLYDELGVAPSKELVELYERIRASNFSSVSANKATSVVLHNLPTYLNGFLGREDELREITTQINAPNPESRLLTVVGFGGLGKTRLAVEAARLYLDTHFEGVYFVSLAALTQAEQIAAAIAVAMNISPSGGDLLNDLLSTLRPKSILLVLDNMEHLLNADIENCAGLVVKLLEAAPNLRVLATSRERLRVRGERVITVGGMTLEGNTYDEIANSAPVQLFVQCAHLSYPAFRLTQENAPLVTGICRLVHGIPLCLELAAAWVGTFTLSEISVEIERNADFLAYEWQDAPLRHRSVRAAFEWSWRLLSAEEQRVLRELSVFRGSFSSEAAHYIARATRHELNQLTNKSLLQIATRRSSTGYMLHELLRQIVGEKLDVHTEEAQSARTRLCEYYLNFVADRERQLARNEPWQVASEIDENIANVQLAWAWAVTHMQTHLLAHSIYALSLFFGFRGLLQEGEDLFRSASECLSAFEVNPSQDKSSPMPIQRLLSRLSAVRSGFLFRLGQYDTAITVAEHAIAIGTRWGDAPSLASGHLTLGTTFTQHSRFTEAIEMLNRALQIATSVPDEQPSNEMLAEIEWNVRIWLRLIAKRRGDLIEAREQNQLALQLCQRQRRVRGEAVCILYLAGIAAEMGDLIKAHEGYEQALKLAESLGYRWCEGVAKLELGQVVQLQSDYLQAAHLMQQALATFRDMGDRWQETRTLASLIHLYCNTNNAELCTPYILAAKEVARYIDSPEIQSFYKLALTRYYQLKNQFDQALEQCQQALSIERVSSQRNLARTLLILGDLFSDLNRVEDAESAYQEARTLDTLETTGDPTFTAQQRAPFNHITLFH